MKRAFVGLLVAVSAIVAVPLTASAEGKATPFKVTYPAIAGSTFTCSGAHVVNRNYTKDSETCIVANADPAPTPGTYKSTIVGGLALASVPSWGPFYWGSDYEIGKIATSFTFVVVDNGDGTSTITIEAFF